MCGLVGCYRDSGTLEERERVLIDMANTLAHRGPDSHGVWADSECGFGLAHRRLAILDLSEAGHQPMVSASGRYVIAYNGEIYNYREIAENLRSSGITLRGGSDTEILLEALDVLGLRETLEQCNGMFAFAAWDRKERVLHLVRDRIGIKPLYYGWSKNGFLFGSELKALRAYPDFSAEIDVNALALFCRHNYIPAPHTIYKGIYKLLPGTHLRFSVDQLSHQPADFSPFADEGRQGPKSYWSFYESISKPYSGDREEYLDGLDSLLQSSVSYRMIADVPVGAFLSGGIDSSLVASLMQSQSTKKIQTFSIGFTEKGYDEAGYAKEVAAHLGTDHSELYVTPQEAMDVIPRLSQMYDEPFADSSQIPTYLVSALARKSVTVSLSGDGGDELFAGYARYLWTDTIWRKISMLPLPIRSLVSVLLRMPSPGMWSSLFSLLAPVLPASLQSFKEPGEKIYRLADVLKAESVGQLYTKVNTHWPGVGDPVLSASELRSGITDNWYSTNDPYELFATIDLVTYLPDDILVKLDRATMATSLEGRVPLLDHRVVEYAFQVPTSLKRYGGESKWPLKTLLERYVPRHLFDRPKRGFSVPVGQWLRGPLREWAEELLAPSSLDVHGFFDEKRISTVWSEHRSGKRNHEYLLWDILMFQDWHKNH